MKDLKTTTKKLAKFFPVIGGYPISGPASLNPTFTAPGALGNIISAFFALILPIFGMIGFIFLIWSGIQFLTSKGDPKALAVAKGRMTYTIIGLIVIFLAYSISQYIIGFFGIKQ